MAADGTRIAIFGGSFNPPHLAHRRIAQYLLSADLADEVWIIPAGEHAFGKKLAPFEHRVRMCELLTKDLGARVLVSAIEQGLPKPNRTVDTVAAIATARPEARLLLVVGQDILGEIHQWKDFDEIERRCELLVLPREGFEASDSAGRTISGPLMGGESSTDIRRLAAASKPTDELTGKAVADYIRDNRLYVEPD